MPPEVDLEVAVDEGSGVNLGWTKVGEWLEYTVDVKSAGIYTLDARVASSGLGGGFRLRANGKALTDLISIPDTGGYQSWQTVSRSVKLDAGVQVLRLSMEGVSSHGGDLGNINWLRLSHPVAPKLALVLVNADTDRDIAPLTDGMVIDFSASRRVT